MRRLIAVLGALLGCLLVPLGLSGPTALLLLPGHLLFAILTAAGAAAEGWSGHPSRARLWGLGYLVTTFAMAAALELGAEVRGQQLGYWAPAFIAVAIWGWIPPVVAGVAGWAGQHRRRRLVRLALRRRRAAA